MATSKKKVLANLTKEEMELLKEAEYQGGGRMTVSGGDMEKLLLEVATYRQLEKEMRAAALVSG